MSIEKEVLYLFYKAEKLETSDLLSIYNEKNYTPQTVRNLLSKLKKQDLIESAGRSLYQITVPGRALIESLSNKVSFYRQGWDGSWYVLFAEIPEKQRSKRDAFRRHLVHLGFGQLNKGIYIYPWDLQSEVRAFIDQLAIGPYVSLLKGTKFIWNSIDRDKAMQIWRLDKIKKLYAEIDIWFKNDFLTRFNQEDDVLKIFINYLELREVLISLFTNDPMLPEEFLPDGWKGPIILESISRKMFEIGELIPENSLYKKFIL